MTSNKYHCYLPWLLLLLGLFCFRVLAQLLQFFFALKFLPPFAAWYSGALSYPWLLASQVLIIGVFSWIIGGFVRQTMRPRLWLGKCLLGVGSVYFLLMLFRLVAGLTFASHHYWFSAKIPTFFHMVLAAFILLVGHFHYTASRK